MVSTHVIKSSGRSLDKTAYQDPAFYRCIEQRIRRSHHGQRSTDTADIKTIRRKAKQAIDKLQRTVRSSRSSSTSSDSTECEQLRDTPANRQQHSSKLHPEVKRNKTTTKSVVEEISEVVPPKKHCTHSHKNIHSQQHMGRPSLKASSSLHQPRRITLGPPSVSTLDQLRRKLDGTLLNADECTDQQSSNRCLQSGLDRQVLCISSSNTTTKGDTTLETHASSARGLSSSDFSLVGNSTMVSTITTTSTTSSDHHLSRFDPNKWFSIALSLCFRDALAFVSETTQVSYSFHHREQAVSSETVSKYCNTWTQFSEFARTQDISQTTPIHITLANLIYKFGTKLFNARNISYAAWRGYCAPLSYFFTSLTHSSLSSFPLIVDLNLLWKNTRPNQPKYGSTFSIRPLLRGIVAEIQRTKMEHMRNTRLYRVLIRNWLIVLLRMETVCRPGELCKLYRIPECLELITTDNNEQRPILKISFWNQKTRKQRFSPPLMISCTGDRTCTIHWLDMYLRYTYHQDKINVQPFRHPTQKRIVTAPPLFITDSEKIDPARPLSRGAMSKITTDFINLYVDDTGRFTAHSLRMATASSALVAGIPRDMVIKRGGWKHDETFDQFYNRFNYILERERAASTSTNTIEKSVSLNWSLSLRLFAKLELGNFNLALQNHKHKINHFLSNTSVL